MLAQIDPDKIVDHFLVCGLMANITQEIFLCNVGQARSREDFIGHFPVKS